MILPAVERSFYFVGGSLPRDAVSYVRRRADEDLFSALLSGEFCYILTSRQVGKSSLMIHTVMRLQEREVCTGIIDLTSLGQNLTVEQWYRGMLNRAGIQLGLEDELDEYWHGHCMLPPLERWIAALQHVALRLLPGPLVIFVDEIDMVRSLPFPTDEFFAGIRACFNRRDSEPELSRLTFCLIGVASPSDLIQDGHITPFNIGRRIELHDFTKQEASALSVGISVSGRNGSTLLQRAVYWTGGHPYLTQRLCANIAEDPGVVTERDVDRLCRELFFSHDAILNESNLVFVRNCILKSHTDVQGLLELYSRIWSGKRVHEGSSSALCDTLCLSGIVTKTAGIFSVRNRIYAWVFDAAWIRSNLPSAELRRQRAERRKGFIHGAALFGAIAAAIATLGCVAYGNYLLAVKNERTAQSEAGLASSYLYVADMNLAQQAWEATPPQVEHVRELLAETHGNKYRGFVWGYWNRLCHLDLLTLRGHSGAVICVAISPDGQRIVTGSADATAKVWDANTGQELVTLKGHRGPVSFATFTSDGHRIVTTGTDGKSRVWYARDGQEIHTEAGGSRSTTRVPSWTERLHVAGADLPAGVTIPQMAAGQAIVAVKGPMGIRRAIACSRDGRCLVTGNADNTAKVWNAKTGQPMYSLTGHTRRINAVVFSRDGMRIVTGSDDYTARVWAARPGQDALSISAHVGPVNSISFSPNGRRILISGNRTAILDARNGKEIVTLAQARHILSVAYSPDGSKIVGGGKDGTVRIWDAYTGRVIQSLTDGTRKWPRVTSVAFAPDGRHVASASADNMATLWDAVSGAVLLRLAGHSDAVEAIAFSPDGSRVVTGSADNTARIWDAATGVQIRELRGHADAVQSVAFSPDGRNIVTGSADRTGIIWDATTGAVRLRLKGHAGPLRSVSYSRDGERILTGSEDSTVKVWNSRFGKVILTLKGHRAAVYSAAFSSQYDRIVTGSYDSTARVLYSDSSDLDGNAHRHFPD